jgi:hypothetical protein
VGALRYFAAHDRQIDNVFMSALSQLPGVAQASIYGGQKP